MLIDQIVLVLVASTATELTFGAGTFSSKVAYFVLATIYYVYLTGRSGQTLGKWLLNIKVVVVGTKDHPDYLHAFVRETIGQIISAALLFLGYFWMIWDKDKQTWHDKIARTAVIKIK